MEFQHPERLFLPLARNTTASTGVVREGSMPKTVRDHLLSTLANLGEAQLKNFKSKLNEILLPEGYDNIPKGVLEKADPIDLTDKMIQSYQETDAVVVAEDVLSAINESQLASRLARNTRIASTGAFYEDSMPKTVRDHLLSTLANLGEAQLKNFKSKLNESLLPEGYDNIPKGVLEKADPIDLTDKMIQSYQETDAVMVAEKVLRAINENQLASRLARNCPIYTLRTTKRSSDRSRSSNSTSLVALTDEQKLSKSVPRAYRRKQYVSESSSSDDNLG